MEYILLIYKTNGFSYGTYIFLPIHVILKRHFTFKTNDYNYDMYVTNVKTKRVII